MDKYIITLLLLFLTLSCGKDNDNDGGDTPSGGGNGGQEETKGIQLWVTNQSKTLLFNNQQISYSNDLTNVEVSIDPAIKYQAIDGFGGTLTGSSAYLIKNMESSARQALLKELFDNQNGIGLESLRISIGASDFSVALYTYCDKEGIENFAIPEIDKRDLIPVLKEILVINPNVKIIASPWSPPAWMKSSKNLNKGTLIGEGVYDAFSDYFVKYIQAMAAEGIKIDAITLQNEADFESGVHPSMKMTWQEQASIIGDYLGPKFEKNKIDTKILILDHNFDLYQYALNILRTEKVNKYVSGTAFHGYAGSADAVRTLRDVFPDKSIYETELSGGGWNEADEMKTMFYYLTKFLIPTIKNGGSNFMMFNIALDSNHGPLTPGGVFCEDCRGVVTVDGNVAKKELEYYLLGHASKVCRTGANVISVVKSGPVPSELSTTAFLNPDGSKGLVVVNESGQNVNITIKDKGTAKRFTYNVAAQSVVSFLLN